MDPLATESRDDSDMKELLKSILIELRGIGASIARQAEQFEKLSATLTDSTECDVDSTSKAKRQKSSLCSLRANVSDHVYSVDMRTGPILHEAIKRYQKNAIPAWSSLYGTHLAPDEGLTAPEVDLRNTEWTLHNIRNDEWTSISGDCWKIPHDNRVSFSFLAPLSDITTVIRVRNFLSHFHVPNNLDLLKGQYFNVWDWFDTGISAYWAPGAKSPLSQVVFDESRATLSLLASKIPAQVPHLVAPWRRIINFQGLTTISNHSNLITQEELSDSDLCPFFYTETAESIFQQPIGEMLWRAVKCHLNCSRALDTHHAEVQTKDCIIFHITFFEILSQTQGKKLIELWPCGELHSDGQADGRKPRKIRESALTLFAIPCSDLPGPKGAAIFWTLVCLRPNQFPHLHYSEKRDDLFRGRTHRMIDGIGDLVRQGLLAIVGRWEEIAAYFDELLMEKRGLLNPEYHDSLLTDDGVFSRSKKYFWAIDFLKEAGSNISDNLLQVQQFVERMKLMPPLNDAEYKEFEFRLKRFDNVTQKLEMLKLRFKNKREEATALRDGLFSASAVMESRAATQQGENIKLLTFVTIFFLPLSFCASLWSINTLFSLSKLAIVMSALGISTYITVFYLNDIASFFSSQRWPASLQQYITSQINHMREDGSPVWRKRGSDFSNGQTAQDGWARWRVLQFAMKRLWLGSWEKVMGRKRERRSDREQEEWSKQNLGDIRVQVHVDVQTL